MYKKGSVLSFEFPLEHYIYGIANFAVIQVQF